ncbi:MAG: hypothetical protein U9O89_07315, partial [Thermoproteota archaeon]|nr:hypothetical protein [Thermoproteota archaeon]
NYVNFTYPIIYGNITYGALNTTLYWDKKTGIMCEEIMSYTQNMTHYYINMSMVYRMTATNMWPAVFTTQDGYTFNVVMTSNSTISNFNFNESLKKISFNVTGPAGKAGHCNVTISDDLLWGQFSVYKDDNLLTKNENYTQTYNGTHYTFYITYSYSAHSIEIKGTEAVPEFPTYFSMVLMLIVLTSAITIYKRVQANHPYVP